MGRWKMKESEIKKLHWQPPDGCWQCPQVGGPCPGTALHLTLAAARGRCREDGTEIGNGLSVVERKQLAAPRALAAEDTWRSDVYVALGPTVGVGSNEGLRSKQDEKYPGRRANAGLPAGTFLCLLSLSPESGKRAIIKSANNSIFNGRRRYRVEEQAGDATVEI